MKALYDIKDMLHKELEDYAHKGELSAGDLEAVHKLTDTIKNIDKICMYEENEYSSKGGEWQAYGSYDSDGKSMRGRSRDGRNMDGGYSSRNRHYVKGHYSYDDAKKRMYHELGEAAEMATTDRERDIINRAMRELENA